MEIDQSRAISARGTCSPSYQWSRLGNMILIYSVSKVSSPISFSSKTPSLRVVSVIGPHWPGVLFTSVIICVITYLNILLISSSIPFTILLLILSFTAQIFLYLTALLDPGVHVLNLTDQSNSSSKSQNEIQNENGEEDIEENTSFLKKQNSSDPFCDVCGIYQPKGTAHCQYCNCCIDGLDHHCPWMGKCIGKKNMKYFQCFIGVVVLYIILVIVEALIL
jgi:hypothetical protein